jgi:putative oxidoreductase
MTYLESFVTQLQAWEWVGMFAARLSVGLLFALSGYGKLTVPARREQMRETIKAAGIPAPEINALVVSLVEFIFGVFLVIGFLTPLCAVMLTGVMLTALLTTTLRSIKATSIADWLGEFFYLPEVLYLVILFWLFFAGAGKFSVDALILSSIGR